MSAEATNPATMFAGKYRLVRILGKGAMGEVWLAEEEGPRNFRRKVAVKRLLTATEIADIATESFIAEAQVIARIDHPNVVRLIELGSADGGLYLVLDFVDGAALDRIIKKGGALSPKAVAYIGREVARALEAVHSMCDESGKNYGVVHRDVSPSNILVSRDGRVRLSDFGVARISGLGGEKTETGVFKGKLPYMPPEQARGEPFDGRADIFSLGVTLFEGLLGGRLRRAETQGQLIMKIATERVQLVRDRLPETPQILQDAIDQSTEFDSSKRTTDAGELVAQLEEALRSFGPRADREAREELKEFVATVTGTPTTGAVPAITGSSLMPRVTPAIPSPTNRPPEWSVPLAGAGAPPTADEPTSNPSAQSFVSGARSYSNDDSEERTVLRPTPSVTKVASYTDMAAETARMRPSRTAPVLVAVAMALLGGGIAALLLFKQKPAPPETQGTAPSALVATTVAPVVSAPVPASAEPVATVEAAPTGEPSTKGSANPKVPGPRTGPVAPATAKASAGEEESAGPGTLQVVVLPWADVTVDGRGVGTTPISAVSLPPGPHSVILRNSELGASRSMSVTIKSGKPTLLRVDLRRTE